MKAMSDRLAALSLLAFVITARAADTTLQEEIVVTARKLPESAFDVPLKISVLSQEVLEDATIDGLYALAAHVPGLSFESVWGGGLSLPTMRGQFSPSLGDTVGVFVDGVYQASRSALDVELLDFARAEAIFGPQSTLYGHSTFAGAIGYVSNLPTDVLAGGATLEGGTDEYLSAQAWLAGPIGGGWLGRLAVVDRSFDGTGVNTAAARRTAGRVRSAGRRCDTHLAGQGRVAHERCTAGPLPGRPVFASGRVVCRRTGLQLRQPGLGVGPVELLVRRAAGAGEVRYFAGPARQRDAGRAGGAEARVCARHAAPGVRYELLRGELVDDPRFRRKQRRRRVRRVHARSELYGTARICSLRRSYRPRQRGGPGSPGCQPVLAGAAPARLVRQPRLDDGRRVLRFHRRREGVFRGRARRPARNRTPHCHPARHAAPGRACLDRERSAGGQPVEPTGAPPGPSKPASATTRFLVPRITPRT